MFCPILGIGKNSKWDEVGVRFTGEPVLSDCLKEKCAWWGLYSSTEDDPLLECCALRGMAFVLSDILAKINTK